MRALEDEMLCKLASKTTEPVQTDNITKLGLVVRTAVASAGLFMLKRSLKYHRLASRVATLIKTDKIIRLCKME